MSDSVQETTQDTANSTGSAEVPVAPEQKPEDTPAENTSSVAKHAMISNYAADVATAMSETDASAIQHFIQNAKDKEVLANDRSKRTRESTALSTVGIVFFMLAIAAIVYSVIHYRSLTVPLENTVSLGAFPVSSTRIVFSDTKQKDIVEIISKDPTFIKDTPILVDIVDSSTGMLLSPSELFTYIEVQGTEPFKTAFSVVRYGFVKISDTEVVPFVVGAVYDDVVASKEFLIAESVLPDIFSSALGVNTPDLIDVAGGGFIQEVKYNIPVRILRAQKSDLRKTTLVYGFVQDKVVVFTTDERVLQLVGNTIISQH